MRFAADGKVYLDWNDITLAVSSLAQRIETHKYSPKRILAVARGGLIPAAMLAHQLGVPRIGTIQIQSYGVENTQGDFRLLDKLLPAGEFDHPETLIVDDLWDTGQTHAWIRKEFPNAVTTTLFFKDRGDSSHRIVSFPGSPLNEHNWVVFPWEV